MFVPADGDDPDRKAQNVEMASAARDASNTRVESIEVANREHGSAWSSIPNDDDP